MARQPNNEYYPKEWKEDNPFIFKDENISLNPDRVNEGDKSTPFSISPQIAEFTRKFGEEMAELPTAEEMKQWSVDWEKDYRDEVSFFVPENRYTHEVITPPIKIEDDLFKLILSPDIYIKLIETPYKTDLHGIEIINEYKFISRTLYTHIEPTENFILDKDMHNDWCPRIYQWNIRWLPKDDAKITFFTDKSIEDMIYCRVDNFTVDTREIESGYVSVPVIFKKGLKKKMAYMKHDLPYLYMRVELL